MHPTRGKITDAGDGIRIITLDPRLDRIQRNATLAHELVHDEYDLLWPTDAPPGLIERGEHFVRGITADRLVPPDKLRVFVEARSDLEGVQARDVAEEFEVPVEVADLALRRLVAGF